MALTLVIGNKNYSSWSLRPWLVLKAAGVDFDEIRIPLDEPGTKAAILRHSPAGKVPCLLDDGLRIWDSLAICEHVNEVHADGRLWPSERAARARARSIVAEMHAGFAAVRAHLPMDIRSRDPERGRLALARPEVAAEVARIQSLWLDALSTSGGPLLFGPFTIADAFYAPVLTRFVTYGIALPAPLAAYSERVRDLPAMQEWTAAAQAEKEVLPQH
jgi:glutathione S-transferase